MATTSTYLILLMLSAAIVHAVTDSRDADFEEVTETLQDLNKHLSGERLNISGIEVILEGDMAYTPEQYRTLFPTRNKSRGRTNYAGTYTPNAVTFWPGGIVPYVIDMNSFSKEEIDELREAMDVYEETTCVKFVRRNAEPNFINIIHTGSGCYSMVGVVNTGAQVVSLSSPGCRQFGTYLHELGHALGLLHEHQMPNRDYYLKFYDVNVDPRQLSQLKKYGVSAVRTFGGDYDLGSIMHYDLISFSFDSQSQTLASNDPWAVQYIGRRYSNQLSFGDVRTINKMYQCAVKWSCKNQCMGMTYHNKKCECVTPAAHSSTYCKNGAGLDDFCYNLVLEDQCDVRLLLLHKNCAKACDFCPRFQPGQTALTIPAKCRNIYPEQDKCHLWAGRGFCQTPKYQKFLHRYCRLSCKACNSRIGMCPNISPNAVCDEKKAQGKCKFASVASRCRDSCGTCLWRKTDSSCKNVWNTMKCATMAQQGKCEELPYIMFANCPSTCNRCYYNKGNCKNLLSDKYCFNQMRMNLCKDGPPAIGGYDVHAMMKKDCPKTCDTC